MNIVFDIFPSHGHQRSTHKLAKLLTDHGHKVYYIGQNRYFKYLPSEIARKNINPYIFNFIELRTNRVWKNMKIAFKEKRKHTFYKTNKQTIEQYDELIGELKPDVILLDHHYVQKSVMYFKYRIPVISVQTAPASEMHPTIPPFRSSHIPDKTLLSKLKIRYLWYYYLLKKRIRFFFYWILYLGEDHLSTVKRISKQTGFPLYKYIDYKHYKGYGEFGLRNIPQFLLSPRDFDFPHPLKKYQYAIGPLTLKEDDEIIRNRRYTEVRNKILQERETEKIFFIYCSLGTVTSNGLKNSIKIFQYVIETGIRNPKYRIVISTGEFINPALFLPIPNNVYLFKDLPQKDILRYCDMMIAHGGQNSITECVMNIVPMLIYPYFEHSDLGGNSARVVYHSLGNRGFIEKETIEQMESKIRDVLHNPAYRNNLLTMRLKFEEKNNSTDVIEIIESIVTAYKNEEIFPSIHST